MIKSSIFTFYYLIFFRYLMKIDSLGILEDNDPEAFNLIGRYFKLMQSNMGLKLIQRKYFNPN